MVWQEFVNFLKYILGLIPGYGEWTATESDVILSLVLTCVFITISYVTKYLITYRLKGKIKSMDVYLREKYLEKVIDTINSFLSWPVIIPTSVYFGTRNLQFTDFQTQIIDAIIYGFISLIILKYLFTIYDIAENYYQKKIGEESKQITEFLKLVVKILSLILIVFWYLSVLGIEITAFLAGFGIAGIVIGLALQEVISDLFASISIYLDQPFEIGDRVEVNGEKGNIEKIGIRSTKIRSLDGHLMVVSNQKLTTENIKNYKKMRRRRAKKKISVAYETESSVVEQIPEIVETIIEDIELVDFDRMCIVELSDYSIDFELMYYVNSRRKSVFVKKSHDVFLSILKKFEDEGIEIPYPKREIHRPRLKEQRGVKTTKSAN